MSIVDLESFKLKLFFRSKDHMHFKILFRFHKWVIWYLQFMFVWFHFSVRMEARFICMNQNHYLLVSLTSQIRLKNFQNFLRLSKMQEEDLKLGCPLNIKFCREKYIRVYVFWQPEMIEIHGYTYMQTRILINRLLVTKTEIFHQYTVYYIPQLSPTLFVFKIRHSHTLHMICKLDQKQSNRE